jgi:hypothetical protein
LKKNLPGLKTYPPKGKGGAKNRQLVGRYAILKSIKPQTKDLKMFRSGHFWHDLRELLGQPLLLAVITAVAGFFILFLSFQFVYPVGLFFLAILAARGLIGRRCPVCDGPLKETGASRDPENAFIMHITWRCPRDGYEEQEKTKGDSGLFGVG